MKIINKSKNWEVHFPSLCTIIPCFSVGNNSAAAEAFPDSVWRTKNSWYKNNLSKKLTSTKNGKHIFVHLAPAAAVCLALFLLVFLSTRYVSLGAIISALCFPLVSYFFIHNDTRIMIIFTIVLGTLVIWAHRKNIERLLKGTENRMNLFAKKS